MLNDNNVNVLIVDDLPATFYWRLRPSSAWKADDFQASSGEAGFALEP
jgi:hypothetical protein